MPMIVVVGNQKGGSGKTMTAVNLASQGAVAGLSVLLVDTDAGQATASLWISSRSASHPNAPLIALVKLEGTNLRRDLAKLAEGYDLVVVDTAPSDSVELRGSLAIADVLVVPVKPSNFELWHLQNTAQLLCEFQGFNPKLRAVVVVSRIQRDVKAATAVADLAGVIEEHAQGLMDAPILTIFERVAYDRAAGQGLGVAEWQRARDKSAAEILALWNAVRTPQQQVMPI